jgi:hypothetical protein
MSVTNATLRSRRRRQRQRDGLLRVCVTVPELELVETLIAANLLDPALTDDREAIESAFERAIIDWVMP